MWIPSQFLKCIHYSYINIVKLYLNVDLTIGLRRFKKFIVYGSLIDRSGH